MRTILLVLLMVLSVRPACAERERQASPDSGRLSRVFGATFPSTYTIYALNPDLLAGWNGPLRGYEAKYIPQKYQNLPILGGWFGQGFFPDREVLLAQKIDTAFLIASEGNLSRTIESALKKIGMPVLTKQVVYLRDYIPMFRELGDEFGMPERGRALAEYAAKALDDTAAMVAEVPEEEKVRVYLAQEVDGLGTVCDSATRTEAVRLAGGVSVHKCPAALSESTIKVSFEQIMVYDPDVLLILHPSFMERFPNDAKWKNLRAVREGRVYFVPHEPFSWLDKPATYMRLICLQWLACTLYPDRCGKDIVKETAEFMKLFFNLDLDEAAVKSILKQ